MSINEKQELRKEFIKSRKTMSDRDFVTKSSKICSKLLKSQKYSDSKVIYCYASINNEVDLTEFVEQALLDNKIIAFPKVKDKDIVFFKVDSLKDLEVGYFNIPEPLETTLAPKGDFIIVPGVAFSKKRERLGYGGGFYDRFLENNNIYTIGVAYDFQIKNELPVEKHDKILDEIIIG